MNGKVTVAPRSLFITVIEASLEELALLRVKFEVQRTNVFGEFSAMEAYAEVLYFF